MSHKDKELELIDAKIAKYEKLIAMLKEINRLQIADADRRLRNQFAVGVAQSLFLQTKYPDCKACEKTKLPELCLEAREKTGKCICEVDFDQLQKLPWPTSKGKEAAE